MLGHGGTGQLAPAHAHIPRPGLLGSGMPIWPSPGGSLPLLMPSQDIVPSWNVQSFQQPQSTSVPHAKGSGQEGQWV